MKSLIFVMMAMLLIVPSAMARTQPDDEISQICCTGNICQTNCEEEIEEEPTTTTTTTTTTTMQKSTGDGGTHKIIKLIKSKENTRKIYQRLEDFVVGSFPYQWTLYNMQKHPEWYE